MVVRKSAGGTPRGQQKPQTPKKSALQEQVEFDEGDDEDLEFEDDSELDEVDEELDDESVDEEELKDSDKEGPETASPPKSKPEVPQKTPIKRKAEDDKSSPAKRVRLEDYLPASQIRSYEHDGCTVHLTGFADTVQLEDVEALCKGATTVRHRNWDHGERAGQLRAVFAEYPTPGDAQAAVQLLHKRKLKEKKITVNTVGARSYSDTVLDVHNLPRDTTRQEVKAHFPGSKVYMWRGKFAKIGFESPGDLVNAIKNPECHSMKGTKLEFAFALPKPSKTRKQKRTSKEALKPDEQSKPKAAGFVKAKKRKNRVRANATAKKVPRTTEVSKGKAAKAPSTPAANGRKSANVKTPAKQEATTRIGEGEPTTPGGTGKKPAKAKTPAKQGSATKTPRWSKSPKTFKLIGATKSPLPKLKFQTPKPKGTPKAGKSTGKKQRG